MENLLVFILVTFCFCAVRLWKKYKINFKADWGAAAVSAIFMLIITSSIALNMKAIDARWIFLAGWLTAALMVYGAEINRYPMFIVHVFLFGLALLSFIIMPYSKFTPYIFPASGFVLILIMAEMHKDVLTRYNVFTSYFFTVAAAFTVKFLILEYLPSWMAVSVAVLAVLFIILRPAKGFEYYADEKTGIKTAAILYAALILQCLAAGMLKNPFFN